MIGRKYAHFSVKYPWVHRFNLLFTLAIFIVSCYELLANENLRYGVGIAVTFLMVLVFALASEFKRKYLAHE
ncbi:hypothetical protein LZU85_02525 [Vibrio sp. IRLE0018]|uniref:hypothetical protein n=1 Tax=Vibrio TaxID=662 RepID=UPI001A2AD2EE|nr:MULTISPECIES: hypothetical protein [Vibrio]MCF8777663.1 hypothetical protein [Vibrio floridensis]NVC61643.1 hypothetical protein [Vibrio sp. 05-20-BW147]HAS6346813.1 hypothetical protein [Vibrio vulnificus]